MKRAATRPVATKVTSMPIRLSIPLGLRLTVTAWNREHPVRIYRGTLWGFGSELRKCSMIFVYAAQERLDEAEEFAERLRGMGWRGAVARVDHKAGVVGGEG